RRRHQGGSASRDAQGHAARQSTVDHGSARGRQLGEVRRFDGADRRGMRREMRKHLAFSVLTALLAFAAIGDSKGSAVVSPDGSTALMYATFAGEVDEVRRLIKQG